MLDDSSRIVESPANADDDSGGGDKGGTIIKRELKTKEDIKNYVKGII